MKLGGLSAWYPTLDDLKEAIRDWFASHAVCASVCILALGFLGGFLWGAW